MLTCDAGDEKTLARALLDKRLIACAKFVPVSAMYWWQGEITEVDETAILMESAEDLFDEIEAEVGKIHSYDTFVLTQIPMSRVSKDAKKWMSSELKATS